jgi:hypothetical protein
MPLEPISNPKDPLIAIISKLLGIGQIYVDIGREA